MGVAALLLLLVTTVQEVLHALRQVDNGRLRVERFVGQGGGRRGVDDDGGEEGGVRGQTQAEQAEVMKKFRR